MAPMGLGNISILSLVHNIMMCNTEYRIYFENTVIAFVQYVTFSAKTRLVRTSVSIEKNLKIICKITHDTRKNMQVFIRPVLKEGRLKSIKTIYHLIRLLMES